MKKASDIARSAPTVAEAYAAGARDARAAIIEWLGPHRWAIPTMWAYHRFLVEEISKQPLPGEPGEKTKKGRRKT